MTPDLTQEPSVTPVRARAAAALAAYVAAIVTANYLSAHYGLIPVLPGLLVSAGTYSAGFALFARDLVQDSVGRWAVFASIGVGGAVSWVMSSPALAVASVAAFLVSEVADMAVYTPLRARGWARAVVVSNTVGAILDTLVFLWLSGFGVTAHNIAGQFVGKAIWATLVPVTVVRGVTLARARAA